MKFVLTFLLLLSLTISGQETNSEVFQKSLMLLTQSVNKDSLKVALQIDDLKKQVTKYETKYEFSHEQIQEWLSTNFFMNLEQVKEEYLQKHFSDWELKNFASNDNFINKLSAENNEQETDMMFFGTVEESEETNEAYDVYLEKYKELSLRLKKLDFKQSVILTLHMLEKNYNESTLKKLNTERFKFTNALDWLKKNKKEESHILIQPAIMEKSFNIALNTMLQ